MNTTHRTIIDLFKFEIRQSERQGLDSITITIPRARQIIRELREDAKPSPMFNALERATRAIYSAK